MQVLLRAASVSQSELLAFELHGRDHRYRVVTRGPEDNSECYEACFHYIRLQKVCLNR